MSAAKFKKKPVVITAEQYTGNEEEIAAIRHTYGMRLVQSAGSNKPGHYEIDTLEGPLKVSLGDWIITGVKGERYPCKPDIFTMTYEPA